MIQRKFTANFVVDLPHVEIGIEKDGKGFEELTLKEQASIVYVLTKVLVKVGKQIEEGMGNGKEE